MILSRTLHASGQPVQTRPMCKYPTYPRYKGSGDLAAAASFSCATE